MNQLHESISIHEKRIDSILRPNEPEKEPEAVKHDELVKTADRVRNIRWRLVAANRNIARMTDRLEL